MFNEIANPYNQLIKRVKKWDSNIITHGLNSQNKTLVNRYLIRKIKLEITIKVNMADSLQIFWIPIFPKLI